ncbi:UNVERIFIED_CONTAM: hypothetical protein ABIC26_004420 [Paenibacillus sp. PvR008]
MKSKMALILLVTSFLLLTVIITPFPYQVNENNYKPAWHHGGL